MAKYKIDFEYNQFGDVTLQANNPEDAEEQAIEFVTDMHSIDPSDITIVSVEEVVE